MCLIKITFLAKGTNRDIYRSITIMVKEVCARACTLLYINLGNMKEKDMLKEEK